MASKQKSSKKGGKLKKIFGKLHLWFGLFIGSIIFIVSITGALDILT